MEARKPISGCFFDSVFQWEGASRVEFDSAKWRTVTLLGRYKRRKTAGGGSRGIVECVDAMQCAVSHDFYSEVRGKALKGGYITVIHTCGRHGQYHAHVHLIATSGGYDAQAESWEHLTYLPYDLLRRKWQ